MWQPVAIERITATGESPDGRVALSVSFDNVIFSDRHAGLP